MTVISQISVAVFLTIVLAASEVQLWSAQYATIMLGALTASSLASVVLLRRLSAPHHDLVAALTKASGEDTAVIPPNPNDQAYERSGLKPVLQLVYSLANGDLPSKQEAVAADQLQTVVAALDNTPAGIVTLDHDRNITYYSRNAPIRLDIDNRPQLELVFDDDTNLNTWLDNCSAGSIRASIVWQRVATKITGEEGRRIFDISASYDRGSQHEVVLVMIDRTDVYAPEDEDLDFVSFAAHELRGPITVIRGYLDVLRNELTTLTPDQQQLLLRLIVSANRLSGYVSNILNASKYDRKHLRLHLSEDRLSDIYDTIADDMQMRASAQNRLLSISIPDDLPTIAADRASISEVLSNLIDNAIKYSLDGGTVTVTTTADSEFVTVNVIDQGIGIPSNVMNNLFHKFYRSHRSRETVSGTGIGLYICKAIVESHGGSVGVKSAVGQGSIFTFSLPIYATVADKLTADGNINTSLVATRNGWIRNHTMMKG